MLSLVDCVAFSGLTPEQLDAVACYKHVPPVVAAEWAESVMEDSGGESLVESALESQAQLAHDHHLAAEATLDRALDQFRHDHPRK